MLNSLWHATQPDEFDIHKNYKFHATLERKYLFCTCAYADFIPVFLNSLDFNPLSSLDNNIF